jgi:hypothetical protein
MDYKIVRLTEKERDMLSRSKFEFFIPINERLSLNRSEFFAFRDWDDGQDILFDIRALKNAILENAIHFVTMEVELDEELVKRALTRGGIDQDYLNAPEQAHNIDMPTITVLWDDGQGTLVDGNHRIVKRYNKGLKKIRCIVVPDEKAWRQFAYFDKDIPESAKDLFKQLPTKEEWERVNSSNTEPSN